MSSHTEKYIQILEELSENVEVQKKELSEYLSSELLTTVSQRELNIYKINQIVENMSDERVIEIASVINKAYGENPKGITDKFISASLNCKEPNTNKVPFGVIETILKQRIVDLYPEYRVQILTIPYIIKVQIRKIERSEEVLADHLPEFRRIEIGGVVKEVLKGEHTFQENDHVEFYYLPSWNKSGIVLEEGKTYLVTLLLRKDERNEEVYSLYFFRENVIGALLIENNIIYDKRNYFGYGEQLSYPAFRNNLIKNGIIDF